MTRTKIALSSAIALYFVVCFEILIMISPFAGFFYSAFNPFLLGLAKYRATRWLNAFFFTHMVVPPNDFLKLVRILGSVLFSLGLLLFLVLCLSGVCRQIPSQRTCHKGPVCVDQASSIRRVWRPPVLVSRFSGRDFWLLFSGLPWSWCITCSQETRKAECKGSIQRPTQNTCIVRGCFCRGALKMPSHSLLPPAEWQPFCFWRSSCLVVPFSCASPPSSNSPCGRTRR